MKKIKICKCGARHEKEKISGLVEDKGLPDVGESSPMPKVKPSKKEKC